MVESQFYHRNTRKAELRKALKSLKEYFNDRNNCPIGINFEVPEEVFARFLDDSKKLDEYFDEQLNLINQAMNDY